MFTGNICFRLQDKYRTYCSPDEKNDCEWSTAHDMNTIAAYIIQYYIKRRSCAVRNTLLAQ